MSENNSTDSVRGVKPLHFADGVLYPKEYIDQEMGATDHTWRMWHNRGLKKANTNTKKAFYFGQHLRNCILAEDE